MESNQILNYIKQLLPGIDLKEGKTFYWSPEKKTIIYNPSEVKHNVGQWSLLHEASHALENHINYSSDIGLLQMEVAAWDKAKQLAKELGSEIDDDHIQDCLDTYREWLHRRSRCPKCSVTSIQISPNMYRCHNCTTRWSVSNSRFCRPYRRTLKQVEKKRLPSKTATFSQSLS